MFSFSLYLLIVSMKAPTVLAEKDSSYFSQQLEGTQALSLPAQDKFLIQQHEEVDRFLLELINRSFEERDSRWRPDYSSVDHYLDSLNPHRSRMAKLLGIVEEDSRIFDVSKTLLEDEQYRIESLQLELEIGISIDALLISPRTEGKKPAVVVNPPSTESRENFAGLLENSEKPAGWLQKLLSHQMIVALPLTVLRTADHKLASLQKGGVLTRRELLHRVAFITGRTLPGIEVLQSLALRAYLAGRADVREDDIGILGVEQGGMTALLAGAIDTGFRSVTIIDYFDKRESVWKEPFDRILYGQLEEFGDAELAGLVAPRPLTIAHRPLDSASRERVEMEVSRAGRFFEGLDMGARLRTISNPDPVFEGAAVLADHLDGGSQALPLSEVAISLRFNATRTKQLRNNNFNHLYSFLRQKIDGSRELRRNYWSLDGQPESARTEIALELRRELSELVGQVPRENIPLNARSNLVQKNEHFAAYDILLDVAPGLTTWGQLLIPVEGEVPVPRPTVIAQHGAGGRPNLLTGVGTDEQTVYHHFAARLAQEGYVVFAPFLCLVNRPFPEAPTDANLPLKQMTDAMNPKVRKAAALGRMRTSVSLAKLNTIIDFLEKLPVVDPDRIGYYGLSYGGYSAIWMPPLEPRIKASIISGHFNAWTPKITNERIATSFLRHPNEDYYNWNVLNRFTHLELIAAMWPRAVAVEYGQRDGVTPPGWYRRAWREVEEFREAWDAEESIESVFFNGGHEIFGIQTFDFLDRWLRPEESASRDYWKAEMREREKSTWKLDSASKNRVQGTFHLSTSDRTFRGLAFRLSRVGQPGDLLVHFGTTKGASDLGVARVNAAKISERDSWHNAVIPDVLLQAGRIYHFEITADWGWIDQDEYYFLYGPRPLGGEAFPPNFGVAFRPVTE